MRSLIYLGLNFIVVRVLGALEWRLSGHLRAPKQTGAPAAAARDARRVAS
ncbi:hypothetical protein CSX04_07742 [Burkholderia cepacia]|nr:hypothetical protein CSX04_07742 [Burkholderia cepacia]